MQDSGKPPCNALRFWRLQTLAPDFPARRRCLTKHWGRPAQPSWRSDRLLSWKEEMTGFASRLLVRLGTLPVLLRIGMRESSERAS